MKYWLNQQFGRISSRKNGVIKYQCVWSIDSEYNDTPDGVTDNWECTRNLTRTVSTFVCCYCEISLYHVYAN